MILLGILICAFGIMMRPFWVPAGLAVVSVMIGAPLHHRVFQWCKGRRYLAAASSVFLICLLVLLPLGGLVATIITHVSHFSQYFAEQLQAGQLAVRVDELNLWLTHRLHQLGDYAPQDLNLRATLVGAAKMVARTVYQYSPKVVASTAHVGVAVCLWLVFLFVFFADGKQLYRYVIDLSPLAESHEMIIAQEVRGIVNATFLGMVATSAVNASLVILYAWISPLDQPFVWGLIVFGLSFIPVIGAAIVWISGAVYLLLIGELWWAGGLAAYGLLLISQIDNIVKPLVMRGRVKIHPLLLFVSLLGGVAMMGPSGLVFGPVLMAVLLACLRIYRREFA